MKKYSDYFFGASQVTATMGRDELLLDDLDIFVWQNEYSTLVQIDENDGFHSYENWTFIFQVWSDTSVEVHYLKT